MDYWRGMTLFFVDSYQKIIREFYQTKPTTSRFRTFRAPNTQLFLLDSLSVATLL